MNKDDNNRNQLLDKSFLFSVKLVKHLFKLQKERKEYVITQQLIKAGTSVAANIKEAQGSISRKEFISKLQISYKEALETEYWLDLCKEIKFITEEDWMEFRSDLKEIILMLIKSIKTLKAK